ncbi:MAG: hypothetical protein A2X70_07150 [Alphaproteobacteria bacterium GWC2_42_16]|nr:MAG: hypothetical protein A2X70_07150 [Alphaproteobacteria bacterium GWC2_42_16]OFW72989.1 MAG: hypothetical protein A2Z80_02915 [Alphaproteobacteria bacterium GWA2_41_27]OFW81548.1 MAG: hypothetical protein A3E50_05275 [Alphaproteobacteria bacterium RIFCSPHIGHO2_12_FULL_42_100]OFW86800.1 MAG: hypothetical protein A2W06_06200 [Alphaproteobacteria bacterium RBG_16_42_14]OFW90475.1 MAG: hypothetical protein A3C41_06075 [Alphaproteobacteria bacterium RIFCSPHIGHO2_02_FULL_42_30]OFW92373.1 MAG: 
MDIEQIKALIKQGESNILEFKKSTTQLKAAFETLCGFLNGHGGMVIIGVNDGGKIVGQNVTDNTRQEIAREISKFEPPVNVSINYIPVGEGKEVIVLQAEVSAFVPHVFDCRPFQRNQSTTSRMPQHQYEQLIVKRGHLNYSWDEQLATGYGIEDLDHEEILRTIKLGIAVNRIPPSSKSDDIEDILDKLELVKDGRFTNAAIVLFAKKVKPNYPQCQITMAKFKGEDKLSGFIDSRIVQGNAFILLDEASIFIQRHLSIASFFQEGSIIRVDHPDLPVLAVREALVNAICHHDYSNRSGYIALAIYEDKLEIWSYGTLPNGLKIEDLKRKHISSQRNKLISDIIYKRGLVEKWGTGTLTMIQLCKEHGIKEPEFEEYSGGFAVVFRFKKAQAKTENSSLSLNKLNIRQRKIYNLLLNEGPLSPKDIMSKLDEDISERTLRLDLAILKNSGFLEKSGQTTSSVWFVSGKNGN